jgi:hypothetical protein
MQIEKSKTKTIKMRELFNSSELKEIHSFIKKADWQKLRKYLNEKDRKKRLKAKGIIADYLYFYLQYKFIK